MSDIRELETDILSSCIGATKTTQRVSEVLDGYRFSDKASQWIWRAITDTYKKCGESPRIKVLAVKAQTDIHKEKLFDEVIDLLRRVTRREALSDMDATLSEMVSAYNQQRILDTVDALIDAAETGDIEKAQDLLTKGVSRVNRRAERTGSGGLVEIARSALAAPKCVDAVPTGLAWVDRRIRGITPGQVFLIAGITGIGKSVSTIQAGQAAMGSGRRVLHVTTEMDRESVTYRYLSRFTGIPEQRIRERRMSRDERALLGAWLDRNEARMNDLLRIEQVHPNSGTIVDVQAALDELERDGRRAALVIIDSPDHLKSLRQYNNWLHESTEVWWGVKSIASKGYSVWTTTQINRGQWEYKLATAEAVADNYNKARIADAFFSINWVLDDQGKPTGQRRLFFGKHRTGISRVVIPLRCDLSRMIMVTEPEPEELEGELVDS